MGLEPKRNGNLHEDLGFMPNQSQDNQHSDLGFVPTHKQESSLLEKVNTASDTAEDLERKAGRGLLGSALNGVGKAAEFLESHSNAPIRSAVSSLQDDLNVPKAWSAFKNQWGAPSEQAPTNKQIAEKMGFPDTPLSKGIPSIYSDTGEDWKLKKGGPLDLTASGTAGFLWGLGTDPTNIIPYEKIYKGVGTLAKQASPYVGGLIKGGSKIPEAIFQKTAPKITEALTGVPSQKTLNYIEDVKGINQKIAEHSADIGSASDATKRTINQQIATGKNKLNSVISEELKTLPIEKNVSSAPIIEKLEAEKAKIRPETNPSAIKEIDKHIDTIKSLADETGNMNPKDLFDAKQYLQKVGKSAYGESGQIFLAAPESARAAKAAGSVARKSLNSVAPNIKEANNQLALLHDFEDNLVKNLLKEGGSERDLVIAGSNSASRQRKSLELLDKILGTDSVKQAKDLSAFSAYANPGLLPMSGHGTTSTSRSLLGLGGGLLAGHGHLNPAIMLPAAAATSPLAAKGLLNVASPVTKSISGVGRAVGDSISKAGKKGGDLLINNSNKLDYLTRGVKILGKMNNSNSEQKSQ